MNANNLPVVHRRNHIYYMTHLCASLLPSLEPSFHIAPDVHLVLAQILVGSTCIYIHPMEIGQMLLDLPPLEIVTRV